MGLKGVLGRALCGKIYISWGVQCCRVFWQTLDDAGEKQTYHLLELHRFRKFAFQLPTLLQYISF